MLVTDGVDSVQERAQHLNKSLALCRQLNGFLIHHPLRVLLTPAELFMVISALLPQSPSPRQSVTVRLYSVLVVSTSLTTAEQSAEDKCREVEGKADEGIIHSS